MDKKPLTFYEKVEARTRRKGKGSCWPWEGTLCEGRPCLNLKDVMRPIYEHERGPIPPGMVLRRRDHGRHCRYGIPCSHSVCVNPWHVEPGLPRWEGWGMYPRETTWDPTTTDHANEYQRRSRAHARKKKSNGDDRDSQDRNATADG